MKKLLLIISMMLITSMAVCADETSERNVEVEIYKEVQASFLWEIPATVNLENETTTFQISVNEAHLSPNQSVKISVSIPSSYLKDESEHTLTGFQLLDGSNEVNSDYNVLTVNSDDGRKESAYTKELSIKRGTLINPFQYAGKYKAKLTFIANTVTNS